MNSKPFVLAIACAVILFAPFYAAAQEKEGDDGAAPAADKPAGEKPAPTAKPVKPETIPRLKDSSVRTMDEVKAIFERGLVTGGGKGGQGKHSRSSQPKQNRIYTVAELVAKFGQPDKRDRGSTEAWTYICSDGFVRVIFRNKGYGGSSGPNAEEKLRLQISQVFEKAN